MKQKIELSTPLLPISVLSNILKVHQRTLRIYDENGLLTPTRSENNQRLYSYSDLEKAKLIIYFTRNLALNLAGVKIILGLLEELKLNQIITKS